MMTPDEQQQLIGNLTKEFLSRSRRQASHHATPNVSNEHDVHQVKELAIQLSRLKLPDNASGSGSSEVGSSTSEIAQPSTWLQQQLAATIPSIIDDGSGSGNIGPLPSIYEQDFVNQFLGSNETAQLYEDRELLDATADIIPIARIFEEAEAKRSDYPSDGLDDVVIRRLLHWFKGEFFTWVNEPPCDACKGKTVATGRVAPTPEERASGAGVVEVYRCSNGCSNQTRFPRYNMPKILLQTRRGRCGEWANCFTLCCRAMGFKARYVHDTTDHLWTEVWSEHKQRWVHCDSCEEAYDQPLLYSTGWGKSLSYCIAFSAEEAVDVTRRYTVDYETTIMKRRRSVREAVLAQFLYKITQHNLKRHSLSPAEVEEVRQRQAQEQAELAQLQSEARKEESNGRESGSLDWRKARGETRDQ